MDDKLTNIFEELMTLIDTCKCREQFDTAQDLLKISSHLSIVKYELFKQQLELGIELK